MLSRYLVIRCVQWVRLGLQCLVLALAVLWLTTTLSRRKVADLFTEVLHLLCRAGYPNSSGTGSTTDLPIVHQNTFQIGASKTSVLLARTQLD